MQCASFATVEGPFFALSSIRESTQTIFAAVNVFHRSGCAAHLPAVDRGGIESVSFCIHGLSACRCLYGNHQLGAPGTKKSSNTTDAHNDMESVF